jgi:hypothetical protein
MTTRTPSEEYCYAFMEKIVKAIFGSSKRMVGYLRKEEISPIDRDMGKHILNALKKANLTSEQLDELEKAFIQEQQLMIAWIFSTLDQGIEKPDLPKKVSLVNIDNNEEIFPGRLNDVFTEVFFEFRR